MRAKAGDLLLTGTGSTGLIVNVLGSDGQPPYVIKWSRSGNVAMVVPDQYATVIPAGDPGGAEDGRSGGVSAQAESWRADEAPA